MGHCIFYASCLSTRTFFVSDTTASIDALKQQRSEWVAADVVPQLCGQRGMATSRERFAIISQLLVLLRQLPREHVSIGASTTHLGCRKRKHYPSWNFFISVFHQKPWLPWANISLNSCAKDFGYEGHSKSPCFLYEIVLPVRSPLSSCLKYLWALMHRVTCTSLCPPNSCVCFTFRPRALIFIT